MRCQKVCRKSFSGWPGWTKGLLDDMVVCVQEARLTLADVSLSYLILSSHEKLASTALNINFNVLTTI